MGRFLWLMNTPGNPPGFVHHLAPFRFDVAQQYDLDRADLSVYDGVMLGMHSDQRHLRTQADARGVRMAAAHQLLRAAIGGR